MTTIPALKQLPAPVRLLIRPMLIAAIGLHALLLFTPLPSAEKPKKTDDKEDPVKITQLPTAKPAAKSRPKLAKPALPKVNRAKSAIAPPVQRTQTPQRAAGGTPSDAKDPFADFPHYPSSTPNCYGKTDLGENCREAAVSLQSVVSYFEKVLPEKKFAITPAGGDGTNVKLFTVSKGGKSLSLSILKDSDTKTVYLLAPEAINDLEKLKKAEGTPKAIADIYEQVANQIDKNGSTNDATPGDFTQPADYYKDPKASLPEQLGAIYGSPKVIDGSTADAIYATLKDYLAGASYTTSAVGNYGGGSLYEIKSDSYTGYLNLVPSTSGGTIVVVWTKKP
ncbi:MAG: hypothetical protein KME27_23875 [Lyngbya sp. HA4199-MV5]|jgi:hypothetical protein|nr:hypothetical protein [Lyngbya sp. HA4199-MV5]